MDPNEKHRQAIALDDNGESEKALAVIDEGLAATPKYLPLLRAKGDLLLKLRDYSGALAAYQRYIEAGATGAIARDVQNIIRSLSAVRTTFLDIQVANGPADIYLDSKTLGVFCAAAPSCHQAVMPGGYKVIADRPGFERWVGRVTVEPGTTQKLAVALVEKLSELTVRTSPGGAKVRIDDKDYDAPMMIAAGSHPVTVTLAGHAPTRLEAVAHEGKPVVVDVTLAPLVPVRVVPPTATLQLDSGKMLTVQDGGVILPPGKQILVGHAQGFQDRRIEVPAERPDGYRVEVVLERVVPPPPPPPAPSPFTTRRKIAIGVAGFGVVSAVLGGFAWDDKNRYERNARNLCRQSPESCPDAARVGKLEDGAALRKDLAYAGWIVGAGAVIGAAALWVTGAPESRVAVSARVGPVAGLDLAVRF